jgi:undecaprenyl pyrophosphate synthase
MTGRALVSDRPSFVRTRGKSHRVVLETEGVDLTKKILDTCPEFAWYRHQCELVAAHINILSTYDLSTMNYLAPEMTPAMAAAVAMAPFVRQRLEKILLEKSLGDSNPC